MDWSKVMEVKIYEYKYVSGIGEYIQSFVKQKRNAGYPYNSSARILRHFDKMMLDYFPDLKIITKNTVDCWISLKPDEHPNGLLRRITPVRQLSSYIKCFDDDCYIVPGHIPNKQIKYDPHIYTKEELVAFFKVADSLESSVYSPYREYIAPVIFRLFFLCGMRHSEVLNLEIDDVNFDENYLRIKESKSWKERKVYFSDEIRNMLIEYNEIISALKPERRYFFPSIRGEKPIDKSSTLSWFHEICDEAFKDIPLIGTKRVIHSFRHTYATERLNRWIEDGTDVNVMYPYFSRYLGHSDYADTDYYIKLVSSFYPEMNKRMSSVNEAILPEVLDDEE